MPHLVEHNMAPIDFIGLHGALIARILCCASYCVFERLEGLERRAESGVVVSPEQIDGGPRVSHRSEVTLLGIVVAIPVDVLAARRIFAEHFRRLLKLSTASVPCQYKIRPARELRQRNTRFRLCCKKSIG